MIVLKSMLSGLVFCAASTIDQNTLIPVGTVLTVGGGIWWLGRKLQHIDDRMDTGDERFSRIERKLENLPCNGECPVGKPKHK